MSVLIRVFLLAACVFVIPVQIRAKADDKIMSDAKALRDQGEFEKSTRMMQTWLDQNTTAVSSSERRGIEFEIERIDRIRQDYRLTREKLLNQLQDRLTTFTVQELDGYERDGLLDVQLIDGQKLYANPSASNLLFRVPELRSRRKDQSEELSYRVLYAQMKQAENAAELTSLSLVLPQDYSVTYTLTVDANTAPDGKMIRCWLPFMHGFPYQADAAILKVKPAPVVIASPEYPHRTVYTEQKAEKDKKSVFELGFIYRSWARVNKLDPSRVRPYDKNADYFAYYTAERKPHIDFSSEELKRIDNEVSAGDSNPLLMARRIYDWIAHNTIYQYAREYSTLDNISNYTAARRAGDCGQHAMLFIALCRMNGIPARWTTGWESFADSGQNMHDWCEFYVEPWGWLPADPDMAVNILNYADDLTTPQKTELADWLFGNMDNYRLTVNSDFGMPLMPAKTDFRSETIDFQRGEVEAEGKNLYFDKWSYRMQIEQIGAKQAENLRSKFIPPAVKLLPRLPKATIPKLNIEAVTTSATIAQTTATVAVTSETKTAEATTTTTVTSVKPADSKTSETAKVNEKDETTSVTDNAEPEKAEPKIEEVSKAAVETSVTKAADATTSGTGA